MTDNKINMAGTEEIIGNKKDLKEILEDFGVDVSKESLASNETNSNKSNDLSLSDSQVKRDSNIPVEYGFIYIPSVKLYFQKKIMDDAQTWGEYQKKILRRYMKIPNLNEIREFLKYLLNNRNGTIDAKKSEIEEIVDDILVHRRPKRGIWSDVRISKADRIYIAEFDHHLYPNSGLSFKSRKTIRNGLLENRTIDLNFWINQSTDLGLPLSTNPTGDSDFVKPNKDSAYALTVNEENNILEPLSINQNHEEIGVYACKEATQ